MEKMEPIFDLHERTLRFATQITKYVRTFPRDVAGFEYGKQLIRAGCSPGSNYEEADAYASQDEYIYKIGICLRESKETRYWLKLSKAAFGETELNTWLLGEVNELIRIFNSMAAKAKKRSKTTKPKNSKSKKD
jgi:four helix bundle protein